MYSKVYIEITNVCNKSCSYCIGTKRQKKFMSFDEFCHILDKLDGVTQYIYLHVMGEPLLHPQICDFIKEASHRGFKVCITTNGSLLSKKGKDIVNAGAYKVNISLHSFEDGDSESHLRYLSECADFGKFASESGTLTVFRLWNIGADDSSNNTVLDFLKNYYASFEWKSGTRGYRIKDKLHLEYANHFEWPDMEAPYISDSVFCYGLKDHFAILSNGTIVPCCLDREGAISLGNIFEDNISEILSSELVKNIRDGFKERRAVCELCKRCGYAQRF